MRRKVGNLPQAESEPKFLRFSLRPNHTRGSWILIDPRMYAMCREKQVIRILSGLVVRLKGWVSEKEKKVQMNWEEK